MLSLILESNDPCFNLAAEEYLLHERKEDFLILSINDPSVIIGKHQVAHMEVNTRFTDEKNIPVLRRISGGGTVYHDRGNLNFAFIRQSEKGKQVDFRYYTQPVIEFLGSLGIRAFFEGKNDLTVNGLKISGNAEHVFRERVLHHGTLLFDASLENMRNALKPKSDKYSSRGVESNRSPVANISEKLPGISTINEFAQAMLAYFRNRFDASESFAFSESELEAVRALRDSKYITWDWNFGYGPPYTFTSGFTLAGKVHQARFLVKDGIIWESDIEGPVELTAFGKKLIGCRHMPADLFNIFRSEGIPVGEEEMYGLF